MFVSTKRDRAHIGSDTQIREQRVKRRRRTTQSGGRWVEEALLPRASVSRVARRHDVNANQVFYVPLPEGIPRRTAGRGSNKSPSGERREGACCGGPTICLLHWFPVKGIVYGQNEPRFLCTHTLVVGCQFLEEERPFSSQHGLDAFAKSSKCGIVIKVYLHQIR